MGNQTWLSLRWRLVALVLASLSIVLTVEMASYILPIYGRSGQIVICIDIANILARGGSSRGGYNLLVWHIGQTFRGAHIWHESLLRWYLQATAAAAAAHNSAPLSTIGPLDLRHIQAPTRWEVVWRGGEKRGGSGSYVCMHANNTLTTFSRHS